MKQNWSLRAKQQLCIVQYEAGIKETDKGSKREGKYTWQSEAAMYNAISTAFNYSSY